MPARLIASGAALAVGAALLLAPPPAAAVADCSAFGIDAGVRRRRPDAPRRCSASPSATRRRRRDRSRRFVAAVDDASDRVASGGRGDLGRRPAAALRGGGRPGSGHPRSAGRHQPPGPAAARPAAAGRHGRRPGRRAPRPSCGWPGNVHGNEESGADAALQVLYELADRTDCVVDTVLDNALVVILPTQNPDGRLLEQPPQPLRVRHEPRLVRPHPAGDRRQARAAPALPARCSSSTHTSSATRTSSSHPHADPEYHETPDTVHDWIFDDYSPAIVAEFEREKLQLPPRRSLRLLRDHLRRHRSRRSGSTVPG